MTRESSCCWKTAKKLAVAERALRDLASEQGDSTMANMILAQRGWVENAGEERDRWRKLAQAAMDRNDDAVLSAWRQLGEHGDLEVVRCVNCAVPIEGEM